MALARALTAFLGLGLLVGVAAGCDGSQDLGSMMGIGEDTNLLTPPPEAARPKTTPQPVSTPVPKPSGPDPRLAYLRRNLSFDAVRSRGITEVYDGRPNEAMGTFQKAMQQKPNDRSVQLWIDAIRQSTKSPRDAAPGAVGDFRSISNAIRNPNAGMPGMAPQPMGAPVGAPPVPPAGGADTKPLDPRQVF